MVCRTCGRVIVNENANFCEYCGTATNANREGGMENSSYARGNAGNSSYRENQSYGVGADFSYSGNSAYGTNEGYTKGPAGDPGLVGILNGTAGTADAENSMSFSHWIVVMLLPLIPMIGIFAYLAVLLIWAFGRTATKTRKNWARATLLITLVSLMMLMYMFQSVLNSPGMMELMNSIQ